MTSRPTVLASVVLALALLGDSLLYAVLPLHAASFGVSLAWVGVLLSANRVVRLLAYPFLPRLAAYDLRRFTIAAAALAAISTLTFAAASGAWPLLASRLAWGVAFGSLSLATLAYATASDDAAGKQVGMALSLREIGPLLSLTAGTWAVSVAGVRPVLAALGVLSIAGVSAARGLPGLQVPIPVARPGGLRSPARVEWLSLIAGLVADGIYPATIALLIAESSGAGQAVLGAGVLLGFKRIAVVVLAPVGGYAADRFGERVVTAAGFAILAVGALMIGLDGVIAGAVLMSCGAAVTATTIPIAAATRDREQRTSALARSAMMRDAGAAAGSLAALALFDAAGALVIYTTAGMLAAAGCAASRTGPVDSTARLHASGGQHARRFIRRQRRIEVEALREHNSQPAHPVHLLGGLQPFHHDVHAEDARQAGDGADDLVRAQGVGIEEERAVELEQIEWKLPQRAEGGVAGAEVVETEPHADGAQRAQQLRGRLGILDEDVLRHLEVQPFRRDAAPGDRFRHALDDVRLQELTGR